MAFSSIFAVLQFTTIFSLIQVEGISETCPRESFQLSLLGRKQPDGHWNAGHELDSYSCKHSKHWQLLLHQNVSDRGEVQHIHLRGYFTDQVLMSDGKEPFLSESTSSINVSMNTDTREDCIGSTLAKASQIKIVSRSEWNAKKPTKVIPVLTHPVKVLDVYVADSSEYECHNDTGCVKANQNLQDDTISSSGDIFGNFHVGGNGRVYEGLGWDRSMESGELNLKYLKQNNPPTPIQMATMASLINYGILNGKIDANYTLIGDSAATTKEWIEWFKSL